MLKNSVKKEHNVEITNLRDFIIELIDDFVDFTISDEKYKLFKPSVRFRDEIYIDSFISDNARTRLNLLMRTNKTFKEVANYMLFFNGYLMEWLRCYDKVNNDYITFMTNNGPYKLFKFDHKSTTRVVGTLTDKELDTKSVEELLKSLIYKSVYSIILEDVFRESKSHSERGLTTYKVSDSDESSIKDTKSRINSEEITNVTVFVCPDKSMHEKIFNREYPTINKGAFEDFMINLYLSSNGIQQSVTLKDKLRLLKTLEEDPENIEKEVKSFYNLLLGGTHVSDLPITPEAIEKLRNKLIGDIKVISAPVEPKSTKKSKKRKKVEDAADEIEQQLQNQIANEMAGFGDQVFQIVDQIEIPPVHVWHDDGIENHLAQMFVDGVIPMQDPDNIV